MPLEVFESEVAKDWDVQLEEYRMRKKKMDTQHKIAR